MNLLKKIIRRLQLIISNSEVNFLKRRATHYGFVIEPKQAIKNTEIFLENYYKTDYKKNALLSYIIYPFVGPILNNHSNHQECFMMAEILNELGYKVDVINWDNEVYVPVKKYDVVIDNHNNLARLSPYITNSIKIFHATNTHWLYQNWVEYSRYYEFFIHYGRAITPPRLRLPGNSAEFCDVISMFGNGFTRKTYGKYEKKIFHLPMSVNCKPELFQNKDYEKAKLKFVWLNSNGALLKGLDIVIDAFLMQQGLELVILIDEQKDSEFFDVKWPQISQAANIKFKGWVDIDGDVFKQIADECAWIIGTSFTEGGGGSILNGMAKGLVPIISKSCSVDLPVGCGCYLETNTAQELCRMIYQLSKLPNENVKAQSLNAYEFISSNHTVEKFRANYKSFLVEQLAE